MAPPAGKHTKKNTAETSRGDAGMWHHVKPRQTIEGNVAMKAERLEVKVKVKPVQVELARTP